MEKKIVTLPYLSIENVKCVSMYESGKPQKSKILLETRQKGFSYNRFQAP